MENIKEYITYWKSKALVADINRKNTGIANNAPFKKIDELTVYLLKYEMKHAGK